MDLDTPPPTSTAARAPTGSCSASPPSATATRRPSAARCCAEARAVRRAARPRRSSWWSPPAARSPPTSSNCDSPTPPGARSRPGSPARTCAWRSPSGRERHYSLCGDPSDRAGYRIAVRRLPEGGGGSVEIHDTLHPGTRLTARRPRNGFAFCAEPAVLLLAGGIGVTPLIPMVHEARSHGLDWQLVLVGRSADTLPYAAELRALDRLRVHLRTDDEHGVPTGAELLAWAPHGAAVYCCGPAPMLAAVQQALDASPAASLHFERFGAAPVTDGAPFTLRLGADGPALDVPADRSALDVLREARPDLPYSCHQGFCGTCEVRVLAGRPEHRDRRLSTEQRAAGALLPCVSRAAEGETLVLDV